MSSTGNHLLASLPAHDLALLAPQLRPVQLQQDQVLAEPGSLYDRILFPERATMIGMFRILKDGAAPETGRATCWDALGLIEASGDGRASARAVVVVPGSALCIRSEQFAAAAQRSTAIRDMAARHAQTMTAKIMQISACNARHSVDQRMATWLLAAHDLACADSGPGSDAADPVRVTHDRLADVLGVQRTTVTLIAQRFQQAGLVRYRRGRVFITDRAGLERVACECNGMLAALHHRPPLRPEGRSC